jgi:peroxiredoxin
MPKFKKAGIEVIGVSKDTVASHDKFAAKYDLTFPLMSDTKARPAKPSAPGSRRASTAGSTWASSAPPS